MTPQLSYHISNSRPLGSLLLVIALCALTAGATWFIAQEQKPETPPQNTTIQFSLQQQIDALAESYRFVKEENEVLNEENDLLQEKLTQLNQLTTIDNQAINDVRNKLVQLQDQLFDLRRELEFYRGIMDTTQTATGLQIQGWYARPTDTQNQFRYKIVLTNLTNQSKDATGSLSGQIYGTENGKDKKLMLKTVLLNDTKFSFKFRNFKVFEGHIQLPVAFVPQRVRIVLTNTRGKKNLIEKEFDWPGSNP